MSRPRIVRVDRACSSCGRNHIDYRPGGRSREKSYTDCARFILPELVAPAVVAPELPVPEPVPPELPVLVEAPLPEPLLPAEAPIPTVEPETIPTPYLCQRCGEPLYSPRHPGGMPLKWWQVIRRIRRWLAGEHWFVPGKAA